MIKKMWQRLLGSLLAIILIVPFSFTVAKADPNTPVVYTNSYGSFTQSWYSDGSNAYNDVVINLKDNYSGTITINWTYNANNTGNNISAWNYLVYGGYISSTANNKLTIKIVNSNCVEIHMNTLKSTSTNQSWIGWQFAFSSWSFSGSVYEDPLETTANSIDGRLSTMNTTLNTIKNTLSTLASSITGGSTLDDLLQQLQDMDDLFVVGSGTNNYETIAEIVYQMRTRLTEFTNSWGFDQNNDFYSTMQSIKNDLDSLITVANGILSSLNTISSTLNNIDNLIDKISWVKLSDIIGYTTDFTTFGNNSGSIDNQYYFVFGNFNNNQNVNFINNSLVRLSLPVSLNPAASVSVYNVGSSSLNMTDLSQYITYIAYSRYGLDVYLDFSGGNVGPWANNYYAIKFGNGYKPYYYSNGTYPNNGLSILSNDDIEYWQLKSYFEDYNYKLSQTQFNNQLIDKLDDVINAIGNVSVSSTDITNITYTFDTNITTINNIHNIYNQQFNEYKNNINNYDFTINNDMTSSKVGINDLFTRFYNIEFFRIPILVIMACAIFLIVLG